MELQCCQISFLFHFDYCAAFLPNKLYNLTGIIIRNIDHKYFYRLGFLTI